VVAQRVVRLWSGLRASRAAKADSSGWWQCEHVRMVTRREWLGTTRMIRSGRTRAGSPTSATGQSKAGHGREASHRPCD
jgi:hypothetical protein